MPLELNVPIIDSEPLIINLEADKRLFIVGANGSGKSALVQHAVQQVGAPNVRRISAHRQTWLQSGSINMTPQSRRQFDQQQWQQEQSTDSRWIDHHAGNQLSSVLFDLVAKDNDQARRIAAQVRAENYAKAGQIVKDEPGVFDQINHLLALAGLEIAIENSEGEELLTRRKGYEQTYSIAQMSDGERNAVILAANVLTVTPGTILIIDEPERHLHRSIIEPFLTALFAQRPDCPFLVATHDVNLPMSNPEASVLVVRSCQWAGVNANAWDARLIDDEAALPEDTKRAILGSRDKILFVEGREQSLDANLYRALFPNVSIIPVGGCDDVIKSVDGMRNTKDHHNVRAFGLIDGDNRDPEDHPRLVERGIHPLETYSVESLYYCMDAIRAVGNRQAETFGRNADEIADSAKHAGLDALRQSGVAERMAKRRCEWKIREEVLRQIPDVVSIGDHQDFTIRLGPSASYQEELSYFRNCLVAEDLQKIIARYPVRESNALDKIAVALELRNAKDYASALLARVRADQSLADNLRQHIGGDFATPI